MLLVQLALVRRLSIWLLFQPVVSRRSAPRGRHPRDVDFARRVVARQRRRRRRRKDAGADGRRARYRCSSPASVNVPVPSLIRLPPLPEITPENVVLELSSPTSSVLPPSSTCWPCRRSGGIGQRAQGSHAQARSAQVQRGVAGHHHRRIRRARTAAKNWVLGSLAPIWNHVPVVACCRRCYRKSP